MEMKDEKAEKTGGPPGNDPWPMEDMLRMLREVAVDAMAHTEATVYDKSGAETGRKYDAAAAGAAMKAVETASKLRGGEESGAEGVCVEMDDSLSTLAQ